MGPGFAQKPTVARLSSRSTQLGISGSAQGKQAIHTELRSPVLQAVWGGVTDDPAQQGFTIAPYPNDPNNNPICKSYGQLVGLLGVGKAPYTDWQRSLDSYTQIMTVVDGVIGQVMGAFSELPMSVQQNTVIVFMSDHGEYAGAHGFLLAKLAAFMTKRSMCRLSWLIRRGASQLTSNRRVKA